jgi:hypothetical protein
MKPQFLAYLILLAGMGQLGLAAGSLAIPSILGWKRELEKVGTLVRQIFWTYAGYILTTNIAFGLISVAAPSALLQRSILSASVTGFIALYWLSRILIQFLYFKRSDFPSGRLYQTGEIALVSLFIFLTLVYGSAFLWNLGWGE